MAYPMLTQQTMPDLATEGGAMTPELARTLTLLAGLAERGQAEVAPPSVPPGGWQRPLPRLPLYNPRPRTPQSEEDEILRRFENQHPFFQGPIGGENSVGDFLEWHEKRYPEDHQRMFDRYRWYLSAGATEQPVGTQPSYRTMVELMQQQRGPRVS